MRDACPNDTPLLGNTFPATIFGTFSAFWITFAVTVVPDSGAYSTYSTTGVAADGMGEPQFYSTFAYFFICMAILNSTYLVASVRTNVAFFSIFLMLVPSCECPSPCSPCKQYLHACMHA